ncbi:MAG: hypothetical protein R3F11_18975 [Verrucomicrobiales bacterium]
MALDRIPEQIPGDEDVLPVLEQIVEPEFQQDDIAELERIVCHRFAIAVRIKWVRVEDRRLLNFAFGLPRLPRACLLGGESAAVLGGGGVIFRQ